MRKFFFITFIIILYFLITTIYPFINSIQETVRENINNDIKPTFSVHDESVLHYEQLAFEREKEVHAEVENVDVSPVELFENQFVTLEEDIMEQLEQLRSEIVEGLSEDMNALKFGIKLVEYESKIRNIENYADEQFSSFYDQVVNEIERNNLSMDIADDFEQKYDQTKRKVKRQILREARNLLGDNFDY